ncbi:MAG: histone deacetylase [Candidatus Eisenbacteria bacterium]|uniref:Histone deacetylase n=1 Tax=Eiseniibacteriota bacterium TaxID=2212470 RepID=A0A538SN26_UNCEI|nr:MAG: histone deacetylase [Candidatus Eisenbacteria bacterium]TMQ66938.1 MAG: histone deacetylase [Candidatus Eisenbacteria bacterium]
MSPPAVVHSDGYFADIGAHVFPTRKFRLLRAEIVRRGLLADSDILGPERASLEQVLRVHDRAYVDKLAQGRLSVLEEAVLELPYSKQLVEASFLCAGGSILAGREALTRGVGINLGGGFHHAFPDHGEGFCVFNDVAIAIRALQHEGLIRRAAVIDLDVHQGNGTAAIFRDDPSVFTFSMHEEQNYPAVKPPSDLDVGLDTGTPGAEYLSALERHAPAILDRHRPDLVAYVAGADPFEQDQLGGLKLSREDLRRRDRVVFGACAAREIPAVAFLAGGYALRLEDTVGIHADMVEEAFQAARA